MQNVTAAVHLALAIGLLLPLMQQESQSSVLKKLLEDVVARNAKKH